LLNFDVINTNNMMADELIDDTYLFFITLVENLHNDINAFKRSFSDRLVQPIQLPRSYNYVVQPGMPWQRVPAAANETMYSEGIAITDEDRYQWEFLKDRCRGIITYAVQTHSSMIFEATHEIWRGPISRLALRLDEPRSQLFINDAEYLGVDTTLFKNKPNVKRSRNAIIVAGEQYYVMKV